ncbi:hypothetical protein [Sphingobacterium sp. SGR-19]|uniref:hypothetical protein n=1 Tax=Sphingobacterium sp. SGR-19 TaxID=2710886 RepID=UPI0013EC04A5|nr:hypothetical protein [Sphingobacterium sp. SGR-19]NGM67195.1 hypothetical protein [Sphingobacterium sp. SGR-19]
MCRKYNHLPDYTPVISQNREPTRQRHRQQRFETKSNDFEAMFVQANGNPDDKLAVRFTAPWLEAADVEITLN